MATVAETESGEDTTKERRRRSGSKKKGVLRYKADRRTVVFVSFFYIALGLTWVLEPSSWVLRGALVALIAYLAFTCAVITHNTIHAPLFRSKKANKLFQMVLTLAYGHPVSAYVPGHNLSHHVHVQSNKDVMRTSKARFRWNLLNQIFFMPIVGGDIFRADLDYAKAMRKERPKWFKQWVLEWVVFLGVSALLLALDWRKFLLYVFIPHFYAAWGIVGINYGQHDGCDEHHEYNHSRNFVGKTVNWLLFNNGFHTIHHLKPGLHWSVLREAHEREVAPYNHPNLNQESMLKYFWKTFIWPGKRVDYLGNPVKLPPKADDEAWIPGIEDTPQEVSLGAES